MRDLNCVSSLHLYSGCLWFGFKLSFLNEEETLTGGGNNAQIC